MAVHFVYRCPYLGPTWRHHRVFDDATVVDWFRRHWRGIEDYDEADEHATAVLGVKVYSFGDVFTAIGRWSLPPPENMARVLPALHGEIRHEEHCVQVLTDDDDVDMAYYFFDDDFLARHGALAAYLLHDDWRLL